MTDRNPGKSMLTAILWLCAALTGCGESRKLPEGVYVSPEAGPAGAGTHGSPVSLVVAVENAVPGTVIRLEPGVYRLRETLMLDAKGTEAQPIRLEVFGKGRAVLDGSGIDGEEKGPCIRLTGSFWQLKEIELTGAAGGGAFITGSHNRFERCSAHHTGSTGFSVGLEHGSENDSGEKAAHNLFVNCDAYMNYDWWSTYRGEYSPGTHADGFGCKLRSGRGNKFRGCRAWSNSDDNWDLFESGGGVEIVDCWSWNAGVWSDFAGMHREKTGETLTEELFAGNGNGFKLGGNHVWTGEPEACANRSAGLNVLRGCISFGNRVKGIDQNNHQDGTVVEHCLAFDNGQNIRYWKEPDAGRTNVLRNNIIFGKGGERPVMDIGYVSENNSWDLGLTFSREDFISLSAADAAAPRRKDGSLPERFGRLRRGCRAVDAGAPGKAVLSPRDAIDLPARSFAGKAPDLGAFEFNEKH